MCVSFVPQSLLDFIQKLGHKMTFSLLNEMNKACNHYLVSRQFIIEQSYFLIVSIGRNCKSLTTLQTLSMSVTKKTLSTAQTAWSHKTHPAIQLNRATGPEKWQARIKEIIFLVCL